MPKNPILTIYRINKYSEYNFKIKNLRGKRSILINYGKICLFFIKSEVYELFRLYIVMQRNKKGAL